MTNVGRPTKYSPDVLKKAQKYVQECQSEKQMPYIEELALELSVSDDTLVEWSKKYKEFSATLGTLKLLQRLGLKRGALEKKLQSNVAMFLLKSNQWMAEGMDQPEESKNLTVRIVSGCK